MGVWVAVFVTVGVSVGSGVSVSVTVGVAGMRVGVNCADCVTRGRRVFKGVAVLVRVTVLVLVCVAVCRVGATTTWRVALGRGVGLGDAVGLSVGEGSLAPAPPNGKLPPLPMIASARTMPSAMIAPANMPTRMDRRPFPSVDPPAAGLPAVGGCVGGLPTAMVDITLVDPAPTRAPVPVGGLGGTGEGSAAVVTGEELPGGGATGAIGATRVRPPAWPSTPRRA